MPSLGGLKVYMYILERCYHVEVSFTLTECPTCIFSPQGLEAGDDPAEGATP